jgi:hypothetical protein
MFVDFHSRYRSCCTINDNEVKISIALIDQFLPQKPVYNIHDTQGVGHNGSTVVSELEDKSSPVTGQELPRGFQEVKLRFPDFFDNGTEWW